MAEERTIISRPGGFGQGETVVPIPGTAQRGDTLLLPPGAGEQAQSAETFGDFGAAAADTASFGAYPRVKALANIGPGGAENYTAALDAQLKDLAARRERSPTASVAGDLTGALAGGGAVIGGMRGLARLAGRPALTFAEQAAARPLRRVGIAAGEGGVIGGLEGGGHTYSGDPGEIATNAGMGMILGSGAGLATPVGGGLAGSIYRTGADQSRKLPGTLTQAATTDRPQLEAFAQRARAAQQPNADPWREMMVDQPLTIRREAMGAVTGGTGPGQAKLLSNLAARHADTSPFITRQTTGILGPAVVPSFEQEGIRKQMRGLGPFYDQVLNGPNARAADTRSIADWLETETINQRGARQAAAQRIRGMLDITGNPGTLDPHPRTLQAVRSDIKNTLRNDTGTLTGAERSLLEEADRRMTAELHAKVPGINRVDDAYAELGSQERALEHTSAGARMFKTEEPGVMRPEELQRIFTEAARPKGTAGPSQEPVRLTQAARAEVERIIGTKPDDLRVLENVLGRPHDWNAEKLAIVFGPDRAQRLMNMIGVERVGREAQADIAKGPQTALRLAQSKAQEITGGAANLPGTFWNTVVERPYNYLKTKALNAYNRGTRDRIAELVSPRDPALAAANAELLLRAGATRDARQAAASILTQRALTGNAGVIPKYYATQEE